MTAAELQQALSHIDANSLAINITGGVAMILGFVQWGEYIRLGFRDRTHAVPLLAVLFMLSNDLSYCLHYARWFDEVKHPFFINQWYLMVVFVGLELVGCWQIVTYSRGEVFPGLGKAQAWAAMGACAAAMFVVFGFLSDTSGDYLSQKTNLMTLVGSNAGIYLLLRRGSRKGQSMLLAWTLVLCAGALQFFILFPAQGPAFRTPQYYAFGALLTITGLLYVVLLHRAPRYNAGEDSAHPRGG